IEYEISRQVELIESGGKVLLETRLFDNAAGVTRPMRSKEEANDYRYFPEPDLPPLTLTPQWIEPVNAPLPPPQRYDELRRASAAGRHRVARAGAGVRRGRAGIGGRCGDRAQSGRSGEVQVRQEDPARVLRRPGDEGPERQGQSRRAQCALQAEARRLTPVLA